MGIDNAIAIGTRHLCVADFLAACARSLRARDDSLDAALLPARNALLAAGLPAVRAAAAGSAWVQLGLAIAPGQWGALYAELLGTAEDLLGTATNFFFMHKPPGLRVRFEVPGALREGLYDKLARRAARWRTAGLVEAVTPGVYEPEAHLFGGPLSMVSVHRLFTADALAWLGYHVLAADAAKNRTARPGPNWAFSLAMLRRVFDALGVVGWEDRDVFDRIRRHTGRRLPASDLSAEGLAGAAEGIRRVWKDQAELRNQLSAAAAGLVNRYAEATVKEAPRWHAEYFGTRYAYVGPREVAAYYAVYHWNRGSLPFTRQALITEALASGPAVPA